MFDWVSRGRLVSIESTLKELIMASAEITALVVRLNEATDEIAKHLAALREQVGTGMTTEEVEAVRVELQAKVERLEALGRDPENPVTPMEP